MEKITNPINSIEFKVKKRWWFWLAGILWNILAIRFYLTKIYIFFIIILISDLIILPDASHFRYIINDKFLEIKCIVYPGVDILLNSITSVQTATVMTFRGFGAKIYENSFGAYKITYSERRGKLKNIIVTPKNSKKFLEELSLRVDKTVILINNYESAFKKKKDEK